MTARVTARGGLSGEGDGEGGGAGVSGAAARVAARGGGAQVAEVAAAHGRRRRVSTVVQGGLRSARRVLVAGIGRWGARGDGKNNKNLGFELGVKCQIYRSHSSNGQRWRHPSPPLLWTSVVAGR